MTRNCWLLVVAVFGLALVGLTGFGLYKEFGYQQSAERRAADYAKLAASQISKTCVDVPTLKKRECLEKNAQEYRLKSRDNRREYDDLAAQQISATWAKVMGLAAVIGMGLSAVGVWLVKTTFDETRNANALTVKALRIQNRPWITVSDFAMDPVIVAEQPNDRSRWIIVSGRFKINNIGNFPTEFLHCDTDIISSNPSDYAEFCGAETPQQLSMRSCLQPGGNTWESFGQRQLAADTFVTHNSLMVGISILYQAPDSDITHETRAVWVVGRESQDGSTGLWTEDEVARGGRLNTEWSHKRTIKMT